MPTHNTTQSASKQSTLDEITSISEDDENGDELSSTSLATPELYANSLVKIYAHAKEYDYENPWHPPKQTAHSGSGFIVNYHGKTCLVTNAHVASMTGLLEVRLAEDAKRYIAKVKVIDNDCDLAILEVKDDEFWNKVKPLQIGEMPKIRQELQVYGFPVGGEELCITEGNVSRIEVDTYSQAGTTLLQAQVSAAINPGNSGGPALSEGNVVGVAFQGSDEGESLGYIIPSLVLEHFIQEALEDKEYKGFPDLAFEYQEMQNEAIRKHFKIAPDQTGVRIKKTDPLSSAHGVLEKNDILLSIDGIAIKNDGKVEMPFSKRISLDYLLSRKHIGEKIHLKLLRNGNILDKEITLRERNDTTKRVQLEFEKPPTYYIASGIVMVPLTHNFISEGSIPASIKSKYRNLPKKRLGDEVVFISNILATEETRGYENLESEVVKRINGCKIHNLREAITAIENNKEANHEFETNYGNIIVVKKFSKKQQQALLHDFDIPQDRSKDLLSPPSYGPGFPEAKVFTPGFNHSKIDRKVTSVPIINEGQQGHYALRKRAHNMVN